MNGPSLPRFEQESGDEPFLVQFSVAYAHSVRQRLQLRERHGEEGRFIHDDGWKGYSSASSSPSSSSPLSPSPSR